MKRRTKGRVKEFEQAAMNKESERPRSERKQAGAVSDKKKKKVKINKTRVTLTVIVIALIAVVGVSVKNVFDLKAEQQQLKEQNRQLQSEKESLTEELDNVNDLDYIEEQARIQLRMIRPGEILYILNDTENQDNGDEEKNN